MNLLLMKKQQANHQRENDPYSYQSVRPVQAVPGETYKQMSHKSAAGTQLFDSDSAQKLLETDSTISGMREWWKKSAGLDTVKDFVHNYRNHPAGWGALLMIHGIPEVTGRLRTKVDNFAIYSALFLATAIASLIAPPDPIISCTGFECQVRKRIFFYSLIGAVVAQVLSIMLAMSFGNALNEAARDCDVFRMFSPAGKGFLATKKVEMSYLAGVGLTFLAMLCAVHCYMGWEAIFVSGIIIPIPLYIYFHTTHLLFSSAGIVEYWRSGKATDDPYDLDVLVEAFDRQAKCQEEASQDAGAGHVLSSGNGRSRWSCDIP